MGPITDAHKLTYQANMALALQQMSSKYDTGFTFVPGLKGRLAQFIEIYGSTTAVKNLGRKADTPDIDSQVEPIWITPTQLAWGRLMELEDTINAVMDPSSQFIKAGAAAMMRGKDEVLRDALFGARRIGQDGGTSSSWAGDTVGVGVGFSATDDTMATGFNVKKLIRGQRYLQSRQVDIDMENLTAQTNAQGMEELYRDITFVNTDYRSKSVLEGKQVREIMGIKIVVVDGPSALPNYNGSTYTGALWAQSGMYWGEFSPLTSDIPLRADKLNRPHPQSEQWVGASRTEDYKVVKILNKIA